MPSSVPQFTNIEDTIVGPFTAKQIGWFVLGGALVFILHTFLEGIAFYLLAFIAIAGVLAFAFYRPYEQPLHIFIGSIIGFFWHPKLYMWSRTAATQRGSIKKKSSVSPGTSSARKTPSSEELKKISVILDTEGRYRLTHPSNNHSQ